MNVTNLENEALNLPATEKSRLIDLLWNSLSGFTLQNEVLKLPAREKFRLMELLWNSLSEPELKAREAAWAAESERRSSSFDTTPLQTRDAQLVFSELKDGDRAERAVHFAG
jgi:putative addiction module component (TIGR02574 family)